VKLDNVVEEGLGDGDRGVQVAQRDEVGVLGETVHHSQDDRLAANARKTLDEVHSDVGPHRNRKLKRLQ
jgi:hypothetical protein